MCARVERLYLRSAKDRTRHLLSLEGRGPHCELEVQDSRKDLPNNLGLTRESLYRSLAVMARDGLVERQGTRLRLARNGLTV